MHYFNNICTDLHQVLSAPDTKTEHYNQQESIFLDINHKTICTRFPDIQYICYLKIKHFPTSGIEINKCLFGLEETAL